MKLNQTQRGFAVNRVLALSSKAISNLYVVDQNRYSQYLTDFSFTANELLDLCLQGLTPKEGTLAHGRNRSTNIKLFYSESELSNLFDINAIEELRKKHYPTLLGKEVYLLHKPSMEQTSTSRAFHFSELAAKANEIVELNESITQKMNIADFEEFVGLQNKAEKVFGPNGEFNA